MKCRFLILLVILCHGYLCDQKGSKLFPQLVVSPDYHLYVIGEAVSMICLVPEESDNESFIFYKNFDVISEKSSTFNISSMDYSHEGVYTCVIGGRRSNEKAIYVHVIKTSTFQSYTLSQWTHQTDWTNSSSNDNDQLPAPLISLEQQNMPEMPITLKCTTVGVFKWKQIRFYNNGTEILKATSSSKMAINEISISMQRTAGEYSCDYQVQKFGRLINSQPSNKVHVSTLDLTTKTPPTISKTPTYQTDREMITKTPTSYTSAGEYSTSSSVSQTTTEIEHKFKAIKTSTFQSYTLSQWTHQTDWTNSSSNDNDVLLTRVYYSIGSLLCLLVMALLIFFLCQFCLPTKRKKKRSRKTSFWMNHRTSSKSRKTSPSFQIPMIVHVEEQNVYEQPDPCTTFMDLLPTPKPSNNQGSFVHSADLCSVIYDTV